MLCWAWVCERKQIVHGHNFYDNIIIFVLRTVHLALIVMHFKVINTIKKPYAMDIL